MALRFSTFTQHRVPDDRAVISSEWTREQMTSCIPDQSVISSGSIVTAGGSHSDVTEKTGGVFQYTIGSDTQEIVREGGTVNQNLHYPKYINKIIYQAYAG